MWPPVAFNDLKFPAANKILSSVRRSESWYCLAVPFEASLVVNVDVNNQVRDHRALQLFVRRTP
jgi:hypothetical protein